MTLTPDAPIGGHGDLSPDDRADRLDLLISRIIDSEDPSADHAVVGASWEEFRALAAAEPSAWRDLAEAQRDRAALVAAVSCAGNIADRVLLPTHVEGGQTIGRIHAHRMNSWGGWAVAAALGLAWAGAAFMPSQKSSSAGTSQAGLWSVGSADDAITAYKDLGAQSGQVISELPERMLLQARPAPEVAGESRIEVIFIRQFVERRIISDLAGVGITDNGETVLAPFKIVPSPARTSRPD